MARPYAEAGIRGSSSVGLGHEDEHVETSKQQPTKDEADDRIEVQGSQHDDGSDQGGQVEDRGDLEVADVHQAMPPPLQDQLPRQALVRIQRVEDRVHASALEAAQVSQLKASAHDSPTTVCHCRERYERTNRASLVKSLKVA